MGCRTGASAGARRIFDARLTLASSLVPLLLALPAAAQDVPGDLDQQGQNIPIEGAAGGGAQPVLVGPGVIGGPADAEPQAERKPAFVVTTSGSVQGTLTDNVFLVPHDRQTDWITTPTGTLDITGRTNKTQIAAEYSVSGDIYAANSQLDGYRQNLLTVNHFEPVKDKLTVDLRASIDQDDISQVGPQAVTQRVGPTNQTQIANATITPTYTDKLGNWGITTLSYSLNEVAYFNGGNTSTTNNLANSTQQNVVAQLASGSIFTQLTWALALSDSISRATDSRLNEQTAEADGEYRINSMFRLPVTVGYDNFSENSSALSSSDLSGVFWTAGIHVVPGPRTDLLLRYGQRYGKPYENGKLTYKISENLQFTSSYEITVQTQQQGLEGGLQGIGVDANGNFTHIGTNLPAASNQTNNNLVNQPYRSRTFQFTLGGAQGKNTYAITGQLASRDFGGTTGGDRTESIDATVGRAIGPRSALSLVVNAQHTTDTATLIDQGNATSLTTGIDFSYKLSDQSSFSTSLTRRHQIGTFKSDEDALVFELSHKF